MILIGSIATREEVEVIYGIAKICLISRRFQNLEKDINEYKSYTYR